MELGILAGVAGIGYLLNQREKDNVFQKNNQQQLNEHLKRDPMQQRLSKNPNFAYNIADANAYPAYYPEYVKHQQRVLSNVDLSNDPFGNQSQEKPKLNMPKQFKKHLEQNYEEFTDFVPANDSTTDNILNMDTRPITDFKHNNMVPFSKKYTQNMAGTGISSGNYIDGSNVPGNITGINSGFDYSTPYQSKLSTFTANDDTYMHKRETGPLFSPAESQTNFVNGMPLFRPDMERYTQGLSNIRNDLRPVEPEMVGPGLNIDPSIPASGGFHDFTRILPNNVNDYKANQLPGQVITGKYFSTGLPTSYPGIGTSEDKIAPGVSKNKPESFWDQTRYPTMSTKAAFQNNFDYNIPDYQADLKPNNAQRDQISYGLGNVEYIKSRNQFNGEKDTICVNEEISIGQGPLGAHIPQTGARSETFMSQDNNIRSKSDCNSQPVGNPDRASFGHGNPIANWYVNETDRGTVNPQNVQQLNLYAANQGSAFYSYDDEMKSTTKETTSYSYSGNAARGEIGNKFWTAKDAPKTTKAEMLDYSYSGNTARPDLGVKFWTYVDEVPTTSKETTQFSYTGGASNPGFSESSRFMFMGDQ